MGSPALVRWGPRSCGNATLLLLLLGHTTTAAEDFSLLQRKEVRFQRLGPPSNLTWWEEDYLHDGPFNYTEEDYLHDGPFNYTEETVTTASPAPPRSTPAPHKHERQGPHVFVYRVPASSSPRNASANLSAPLVDAARAVAASGATNASEIAFPFQLVLPKRLGELHKGPLGPLPALLENITDRLCRAAGLQPERILAKDVKGDSLKHDPFATNKTAKPEKLEEPAPPGESPGNTTVIEYQVLPGTPRAEEVFHIWKALLGGGQSYLTAGHLGHLLNDSKLLPGQAPNLSKIPCGEDKNRDGLLSAEED